MTDIRARLTTVADQLIIMSSSDELSSEEATAMINGAELLSKVSGLLSKSEAVPVSDWRIIVDQRVLLYIVHDNAKYEKDEAARLSEWEAWCVGYWTDFNKGGWVWNGLAGVVTHVHPLPAAPNT